MAGLRTPIERVEHSLEMRAEGLGVRVTASVKSVSPTSIIPWEKQLAGYCSACVPAVTD
ncbi:hypothetical protein [Rubidibacter lacunae]|uniref:hypothetical protein n=1 Tax=Rubidibacter lacunae TaxID=582514 RepID=UPI00041A1C02|nr:hypothetical protein [Rubidibacter lacunae]